MYRISNVIWPDFVNLVFKRQNEKIILIVKYQNLYCVLQTWVWLYDVMSDEEIQYHHGTVWLKFLTDQEIFYLRMNTIWVTGWFTQQASNLNPMRWDNLLNGVVVERLYFSISNLRLKIKRQLQVKHKLTLGKNSFVIFVGVATEREKTDGLELKKQYHRAPFH